jgi:SAM-dependent methyltransferase
MEENIFDAKMTDYREIAYSRYQEFSAPDYESYAASYDRRVSRVLDISPDWSCLDIACGFGNFLAYIEKNSPRSFIGIDGSKPAIEAVCKRFGNGKGVCTDAFLFLHEHSSQFDLISSLDFLEHLSKSELYEFLDLVVMRLALGGKFLVRVPNAAGLFGMASRYNDITHELCFTPNSLRDILNTKGLRTLAIWEDTGKPTNILQLGHRALWEVVRLGIRTLDAIEMGVWGEGVLTRNMWALAEKRT